MPPRSKKSRPPTEILAPVPDAILNQFAPEGMLTAADVEAATRRFKKALLERVLGAELGHHLAQEGDTAGADAPANHRNGSSAKTVLTDDGAMPTIGVCTTECAVVGDCPASPGGTAPVSCLDVTADGTPECILDCSAGGSCPAGMNCFAGFLCAWS